MDALIIVIFATISQATPLVFTALGGMVSERSGVVNIGLEGMMTFGAFTGASVISLMEFNEVPLPGFGILLVGVVSAAIGGGLFGLLHSILCVKFNLDQTISGISINILTLGLSLYLCSVMFGNAETDVIQVDRITFFGNKLYLISVIALILIFVMFYVFKKTVWAKHVDAVGENPSSADAMGLNVLKIRYVAVTLSGILAGIGGMSIVLTTTGRFSGATVAGLGFIALAVMLFGNRKPINILWASLIFGLLKSASTVIKIVFTELPFDDVYLSILPYVLTIVILVIFSRNSRDPKALGSVYSKETR